MKRLQSPPLLILVGVALVLMAPPCSAALWHIAPDGDDLLGSGGSEDPFGGIARGVQAASPGDTLLLLPGTFLGEEQRGVQVAGLPLNLISRDGPGSVIIDLELLGNCLNFTGESTDTSLIAGLNFRNGLAEKGGAISLSSTTVRISRCSFRHNEAVQGGGAIHVGRGGTLLGEGSIFKGNNCDDVGGAIFIAPTGGAEIVDCLLVSNRADVVLESELLTGQAEDIDGFAWVTFPVATTPWSELVEAKIHLREIWVERAALSGTELEMWVEGYGCVDLLEQVEHPDCDEVFSDEGCLNLTGYWSGDSLVTIPEPWTFPADTVITLQGDIYSCETGQWCQCWVSDKRGSRGWALPLGSFQADLELLQHGSGSRSPGGGAIALADSATLTLNHCTVAGNMSGFGGGGLAAGRGCSIRLTNSIVYGNVAPAGGEIDCRDPGSVEVFSCNIKGQSWGGESIDSNPHFLAPGVVPEGYALSDSSPSLGIGDPAWLDSLDLLGGVRPSPPLTFPDQGCLESVRGWPVGVPEAGMAGVPGVVMSVFPNPFNPQVTISLKTSRREDIHLAIHDVSGRRLKVIQRGILPPGRHDLTWDGTGAGGVELSSGVYFARLETGAGVETSKLVLMR